MMKLSYHARVFLAGLVAVVVLVGGVWAAWQYYAFPHRTFSNGMSMRMPRSWKSVDVSVLPEEIRPIVVYQNPKNTSDRFTIVKQRVGVKTLDKLAILVGTSVKQQQGAATVDKKTYLGANKTRPFVLVHGPLGDEEAATIITIKNSEYLVVANFPKNQEGSFGKAAVDIMQQLQVK